MIGTCCARGFPCQSLARMLPPVHLWGKLNRLEQLQCRAAWKRQWSGTARSSQPWQRALSAQRQHAARLWRCPAGARPARGARARGCMAGARSRQLEEPRLPCRDASAAAAAAGWHGHRRACHSG